MSETIANLVARARDGSDDDFILSLSERLFAPYSLHAGGARAAMASMLAEVSAVAMVAEARERGHAEGDPLGPERRAGFFVLSVRRLGKRFGPWDDPATAHLDAIGVRAEVRGRGVGRFLMASAEAAARARGAVGLALMTAETNTRARQLFVADGFVHVVALDQAYARGQRGILMMKPLC